MENRPTVDRLKELFLHPDDGRLFRRVERSSDIASAGPVGCMDGDTGYLLTRVDGHYLRVHQIVYAMTRGRWPEGEVDHVDGDKTNNEPSNLRDATRSENQHNRGKQRNNTSGYKGVLWSKQRKKWLAQIMVDRKVHYLGLFDDPRAAHEEYKRAALKLRGKFAKTD